MAHGFETDDEKKRKLHLKKMFPAIVELENSLGVLTTNEPINRKEGNIEQADLEKRNARSFRSAIRFLGRK